MGGVVHAFTVDVEDWYHDWAEAADGPFQGRVEANTLRLLELLQAQGARGTFFFLGEVAERCPSLVQRVADAGNEVGSHGYRHRPVTQLTRREFRDDVSRSLRVIEDTMGRRVRGYRAPYFSIKAGVRWPIEVLSELGVEYDASILPIDRPPGLELVCARRPFRHPNGLWEIPVAVLQIGPFWHLPLASGAGLRLLPRRLLDRCVRRFEREVGSAVFYVHPWELDAGSPTRPGGGRWLLRVGRRALPQRLSDLLRRVSLAPIVEVFAEHLGLSLDFPLEHHSAAGGSAGSER